MPWAVAAAVAGAVVTGYASNKAAGKQADSADAARRQGDSQYAQTRTDQLAQLERQRADQAPYREAGNIALSQMSGGTANGGEFNRKFGMADFKEDPGYQFRLQQGEQAINRAATANGARYSGATLKALSRFSSGQASQEFGEASNRYNTDVGNRFNRLASLAGMSQTATQQTGNAAQNAYGTIAQAGQNNAANASAALQNGGAARASGYVGTANAVGGALGGAYNAYQQNQMLSGMSGYNGNNTYSSGNQYSGGNDGYTLSNGESLGS